MPHPVTGRPPPTATRPGPSGRLLRRAGHRQGHVPRRGRRGRRQRSRGGHRRRCAGPPRGPAGRRPGLGGGRPGPARSRPRPARSRPRPAPGRGVTPRSCAVPGIGIGLGQRHRGLGGRGGLGGLGAVLGDEPTDRGSVGRPGQQVPCPRTPRTGEVGPLRLGLDALGDAGHHEARLRKRPTSPGSSRPPGLATQRRLGPHLSRTPEPVGCPVHIAVRRGGVRDPAGEVLPAERRDVELRTRDGLALASELALPCDRPPVATLVCLHPLPTQGGSMDSHLLRRASYRLPHQAGLAVQRFNTRGTSSSRGTSDGAFDSADGERRDVAAALELVLGTGCPTSGCWAGPSARTLSSGKAARRRCAARPCCCPPCAGRIRSTCGPGWSGARR